MNPTTASVSVALCTYNGERFIAEQLDSIARQNRPINQLIICDDGSTDATLSIIESFISRLPIQLTRNAARLGITRNFEHAISQCTGDVIFLCDQDDRWMPDKVQALLERLTASSAAMVFSNAQVVDENLNPLGYGLWDSIWFDEMEQKHFVRNGALPVLLRHAVAAGSTLAFDSYFLPLLLPIPDLPHAHDIWIALLLSCIGSIVPVNVELIQYRLHTNNQVGMKRYGLIDQIRMARWQLKTNAFLNLTQLHQAALDRLKAQSRFPVSEHALKLLQEKITHSDRRHTLPRFWPRRLPIVLSEVARGNYRKYSYGWKSVLQDLFLR